MSNNAQKTPIPRSLNQIAENRALSAIQKLGKALPCSVLSKVGSIITVQFEIQSGFTLPSVTIPMFGPEYIRYPIQRGDLGMVIPADARLGGVSGLGGGIADLSLPANLTALVFLPISNTAWSSVDPDAVTIYGPNGVVLRNTASNTVMTLTPAGISVIADDFFTIECGGTSFTMNADGTYQLSGNTGTLQATTNLDIVDADAHTSPSIMNIAWTALVTWLNSHTHTSSGAGVPTTPFTGGNIAPSI